MLFAMVYCGCKGKGPLRRQAYATPIYSNHTIEALQSAYTNWSLTAASVVQDTNSRLARNRVLYDLLRLSDHHYEQFKAKLYVGDAGGNSVIDLTSIGLTTAAGAIGGGTGQILSLTDTALKGAQGKLTERWLNNKAMRVVVLAMDASRADIRTLIYQRMKQDQDDFPIEEGLQLIARYHAAASLPNALTYLEATMGERNRDAEARASSTTTNRVADSHE